MDMKITERDKKVLMITGVVVLAILGYVFGWPQIQEWRSTSTTLKARSSQLKLIAPGNDPKAIEAAEELNRKVPIFEMPQSENDQAVLFRDRFNEQIKKAGIKVKTLQPVGNRSSKRVGGVKVLKFQCRGRCSLDQILNLLADLNSNQYLAGIEDISMKCDAKDRRQMDLVLTVSTFAK